MDKSQHTPQESSPFAYLMDTRLSWSAKGLYTLLQIAPQGVLTNAFYGFSKDPDELTAAMEELKAFGILFLDDPNASVAREVLGETPEVRDV